MGSRASSATSFCVRRSLATAGARHLFMPSSTWSATTTASRWRRGSARTPKDIAAGAVLIASVTAVAVGYLVFANRIADRSTRVLDRLRDVPVDLTLIALVLTIIVVIATKALTGSGTPLRGGLPSGHAAIAF